MKIIELTQGMKTAVDDEDYYWLVAMGSWCASNSGNNWYAYKKVGNETVYMHKEILKRHGREGEKTDHEDRDGLNNQKGNLKPTSNSLNILNQDSEGVTVLSPALGSRPRKRYRAQLRVNGVPYLDKCFSTYDEAKAAYEAEKSAHL